MKLLSELEVPCSSLPSAGNASQYTDLAPIIYCNILILCEQDIFFWNKPKWILPVMWTLQKRCPCEVPSLHSGTRRLCLSQLNDIKGSAVGVPPSRDTEVLSWGARTGVGRGSESLLQTQEGSHLFSVRAVRLKCRTSWCRGSGFFSSTSSSSSSCSPAFWRKEWGFG